MNRGDLILSLERTANLTMTRHIQAILLRYHRVFAIGAQLVLIVAANYRRIPAAVRRRRPSLGDGGVVADAALARRHPRPHLHPVPAERRALAVHERVRSAVDRRRGGRQHRGLLPVAQTPLGPLYPRSIFVIDAVLLTLFLGGIRMPQRTLRGARHGKRGKRVLIFGAGDAGEMIVRDMKTNRAATRTIRSASSTTTRRRSAGGSTACRCSARGTICRAILKQYRPDEVLIAIPRAEPAAIRSIVRALEPFKIPIKTLPNLRDIIDGRVEIRQIRNLSIEDLLARAPVGLDRRPLHRLIAGRRVMVTGAGGSIGSELCRQIAGLKPASLVMFERYENSLHDIRDRAAGSEARRSASSPIIGDVTDAARVNDVLRGTSPRSSSTRRRTSTCRSWKRTPARRSRTTSAARGSLAEAADAHGVERFIMISTDKAVNPTSVMGATKRVAELVVQAQAIGSGTSFSTVRFGNVLGSNGSVVPRFLEQIRKGGPVTVTHPEMRRFFMLIPEAVQLVLHAASQAESGATYVLDMGEQVKLVDMARNLIRLSGLVPDEDIKIEFSVCGPARSCSRSWSARTRRPGRAPSRRFCACAAGAGRRPISLRGSRSLELEAARGHSDAVMASMKDLVGLRAFLGWKRKSLKRTGGPASLGRHSSRRGRAIVSEVPRPAGSSGRARIRWPSASGSN